jgi:hypothetical protein
MARRSTRERALLVAGILLTMSGVLALAFQAAWIESVLSASGGGTQTGNSPCGGSGSNICLQGVGSSDWLTFGIVVGLAAVAVVSGALLLRRLARIPRPPAFPVSDEAPAPTGP